MAGRQLGVQRLSTMHAVLRSRVVPTQVLIGMPIRRTACSVFLKENYGAVQETLNVQVNFYDFICHRVRIVIHSLALPFRLPVSVKRQWHFVNVKFERCIKKVCKLITRSNVSKRRPFLCKIVCGTKRKYTA